MRPGPAVGIAQQLPVSTGRRCSLALYPGAGRWGGGAQSEGLQIGSCILWGSRHGAQRRGQPRDVGTWIVLDACLFLLAFLAGCMEKGELSHF